jgi:hypothetical protein
VKYSKIDIECNTDRRREGGMERDKSRGITPDPG